MTRKLVQTSALAVFVLVARSASAQTTAAGPYYANPSWDQKLPAATRFIVLSNWNNEAVLDRETGLVWERSPDVRDTDWFSSMDHCVSVKTGGRKGWRLPTINELESLLDPMQFNPALPPGHPFDVFSGQIPRHYYWSSTDLLRVPNVARVASFFEVTSTVAIGSFKTDFLEHHAWCVRGGSGLDAQ